VIAKRKGLVARRCLEAAWSKGEIVLGEMGIVGSELEPLLVVQY
jgi:hypothetical protein